MNHSILPLPPQGEIDADGRHVHPYVRTPTPDPSARTYHLRNGKEMTAEDRSRESRHAFHAIEPLLGHLTPSALMFLVQSCIHRLYSPSLADVFEVQGVTREQLDPRGELVPFEDTFGEALAEINDLVEQILDRCPRCGGLVASHNGRGHS
jgi:hypothetical protein